MMMRIGLRLPLVGLLVAVGALVLASSAFARGTWGYSSADHTQLQINFSTDNGQPAVQEVFVLSVPVVSATCPGAKAGTVGQPDGNPDEVLCPMPDSTSSGTVSVTTSSGASSRVAASAARLAPGATEMCSATIGNTASFPGEIVFPLAQADITPVTSNCGTSSCPTGQVGTPPNCTTPPTVHAPVNTVRPRISGTVAQGETLTADTGTWTNAPTSFTFQWLHCVDPAQPGSCAPISGAMGSTYVVDPSDVGDAIAVIVTAKNADGSTPAASNLTPEALPPPDTVTVGNPQVSPLAANIAIACGSGNPQNIALCNLVVLFTALAGGTSGHAPDIATAAISHGAKPHKAVVVGKVKVTIRAGHSKTVRVTLNRTGRRLLAKDRTLKVKVTITENGKTVRILTVTFTAKPTRKHTHH